MTEWHPPIEPFDRGMLDVGDGNLVFRRGGDDDLPGVYARLMEDPDPEDTLAFVRLTAHYYANGGFLADGAVMLIDDHSGHRGSPVKRAWMLDALARFAER